MQTEFSPVVRRLVVAQMSLHATMSGARMAAPLLALQMGHEAARVGVLLALFALAQVFLALPVGRYVDRHGLRRPVFMAVFTASLAVLAAALWPSYGVLCLTAVGAGAASCTAMVAVQRHAGRLSENPAELREIFSWLAVAPTLANFAGPLSTGLLIDALGFSWAFALLCLVPGVAALAAWPLAGGARRDSAPQPSVRASFALLRHVGLRKLLLVNWMLSSCYDVHAFMVPLLGHALALSAGTIGGILGGFALAATAIRLIMPWVARHVKEMHALATAMLATGVLLALYPWADAAWMMAGLSVLLGVSLGSVQPMLMSTLHQVTPRARQGEALGLRVMTIYASSVLMPLLIGSVGAWAGAAMVFWVMGGVVASGARLALSLKPEA
jgi:MFS family permease